MRSSCSHHAPLLSIVPALLVCVAACQQPHRAHIQHPNLLLVDIDSLSDTYLGPDAAGRSWTPTIDGLAARGHRFNNMSAQSGWTLPSVVTTLTGTHPPPVQATETAIDDWYPGHRTLPEILSWYGYETAVFWNATLPATSEGISKGFQHVFANPHQERPTCEEPLAWLMAEHEAPTFTYMHEWDLHQPRPPPPAEWWGACLEQDQGGIFHNYKEALSMLRGRMSPLQASQMALDHYRCGLAWYDSQLGNLLTTLEGAGRLQDTVIMLTSGHGEDLFQHRGVDHGTLYETVLHVPLLIVDSRRPGGGKRIEAGVQAIDLAPTLLDLAGVPADNQMEGRSLAPLLQEPAGATAAWAGRDVYAATDNKNRSLRVGAFKILQRDMGFASIQRKRLTAEALQAQPAWWELYDLDADPWETQDLAASQPAQLHSMRQQLEGWTARVAAHSEGGETLPMSDEQRRVLQERGYWQHVASPQDQPPEPAPNAP